MKIASRRNDRETRKDEIDEILHAIQNHAWNEGYFEGKDSVINRIKETIEEF
jgi:predicted small metal-binding protein